MLTKKDAEKKEKRKMERKVVRRRIEAVRVTRACQQTVLGRGGLQQESGSKAAASREGNKTEPTTKYETRRALCWELSDSYPVYNPN